MGGRILTDIARKRPKPAVNAYTIHFFRTIIVQEA
jgi:hypothetical protein